MSHGGTNGVIHTDCLINERVFNGLNDFEKYTIDEIFEAVNSNSNLSNSFIIIVIQVPHSQIHFCVALILPISLFTNQKACRGNLPEATVNQGDSSSSLKTSKYSCRVPVFKLPNNSIVVFATVEGK